MKNIRKVIGLRTLKTAVGAAIAIVIAETLNLQFALSAGVITILSVQNTKKASIKIALQRFGSTVLALFISAVLFVIIGYNPLAFGLYLAIFIPLAVFFKLTDGIVVSSVLVTHLLTEKSISIFWIKNELMLMLVGAGIAIVLNIYMPKIEKDIKENQREIEDYMRQILFNMAKALRMNSVNIEEERIFNKLQEKLKEGTEKAYRNMNNYLLNDAKYYVKYMEMRNTQFDILRYMRSHFTKFYMNFEQTEMVAAITERVAGEFDEYNKGDTLIEDLNSILKSFKVQKLPSTREEFENRALLFQFLNDLEYLLQIKKNFAEVFFHSSSNIDS